MRPQGFRRVVLACELSLGEQGVNLAMTNAMQQMGLPAAARLWNQMVGILLGARYRSIAEWANRLASWRCDRLG